MARQPQAQHPPSRRPSPPPAGLRRRRPAASLTIDLGAIAANYKTLLARVMPSECAAVVKGDAYGCGIDQVTTALARAGCQTFFVAHLSEARRVRAIAPEGSDLRAQRLFARRGTGFR